MTDKIYGIKEAAEYLGLTPRGVQWHLYETKLLDSTLIGKTRVFTKKQLDDFKKVQPKRGPKSP